MELPEQVSYVRFVVKIAAFPILISVLLFGFNNCGQGFEALPEAVFQSSQENNNSSGNNTPAVDERSVGGRKTYYLPVDTDFACNTSQTGTSNKNIRRLSGVELRNSLIFVFGSSVLGQAAIGESLALLPIEGNTSLVEAWKNDVNYVEGLFEIGKRIGNYIFADSARTENLLKGCSAATVSAQCKASFLAVAKRILRRPLTAAEAAEYENFVAGFSDKVEGRKFAVIRLLMSPYFHQHMEMESTNVSGGKIRLNQYEIASRLAYRLTAFPPDDQLLTAADNNQLSTVAQVKVQAERLVASANARKHFRDFLTSWLHVDTKLDPHPHIQKVLAISSSGLSAEMKDEFDRWVDYVVYENNGKFEDLLQARVMFPTTSRLAKILDTAQSTGAVTAPDQRAGLLFRPLVMNIGQANSNPIARGVLMRKHLLCMNLPSPNSQIVNSRLDEVGDMSPVENSTRQIVTHITSSQNCMGCHAQINTLGFAFENFGPFGNYRTTEHVFDLSGNIIATHAVDSFIGQVPLPGRAPANVSSSIELMRELSTTPSVMRCYSQQLFRYTHVREALPEDGCSLNEPAQALINGATIKESIVNNVANDEIFWRKASE